MFGRCCCNCELLATASFWQLLKLLAGATLQLEVVSAQVVFAALSFLVFTILTLLHVHFAQVCAQVVFAQVSAQVFTQVVCAQVFAQVSAQVVSAQVLFAEVSAQVVFAIRRQLRERVGASGGRAAVLSTSH